MMRLRLGALGALVVLTAAGCASDTGTAGTSAPTRILTPSVPATQAAPISAAPADTARSSGRTALAVLTTLAVKGRAPKTGYSRAAFGASWTDDNSDPMGHSGGTPANGGVARGRGCDTRNDILRRDLTGITYRGGTHECVVFTGTLHDPYTGRTISFVRGERTSIAVQIDHVVALSDAWQTGAQYWSKAKRTDLANDPPPPATP